MRTLFPFLVVALCAFLSVYWSPAPASLAWWDYPLWFCYVAFAGWGAVNIGVGVGCWLFPGGPPCIPTRSRRY